MNVFEMLAEGGKDSVFLQKKSRSDWGVFKVVGWYPECSRWLDDVPAWRSEFGVQPPIVFGVVNWLGGQPYYSGFVLSRPESDAYRRVDRPSWWNPPRRRVMRSLVDKWGNAVSYEVFDFSEATRPFHTVSRGVVRRCRA